MIGPPRVSSSPNGSTVAFRDGRRSRTVPSQDDLNETPKGEPRTWNDILVDAAARGDADGVLRVIEQALPGAGAVFAPRLLVAFGEQRERYASAEELQKYAGIAPVTERSGKKSWVHWRLQCPTFLRPTFVEWAAESTRHAFWAQVYYQQQRDKGKAHQAAVRALAFKWIRILYRCWQERTPYNESVYLQALNRRSAPLLHNLAH